MTQKGVKNGTQINSDGHTIIKIKYNTMASY